MKKIPMRQCIGCGTQKSKNELIRIIKTDEGKVILDKSGRKNGRGAYLCDDIKCLEITIKKKGLDRSFKEAVPDTVYEELKKCFQEGVDETR